VKLNDFKKMTSEIERLMHEWH
jgi:26S proteasome non-ATPase regulatory subunit 9